MKRINLYLSQETSLDFPFAAGMARLSVRPEKRAAAISLPYKGAYGMGERYDALNQKGRMVVNRVEEKFCNQGDKTYCPAPFFFTDSGFGLYADTLRVTAFEFGDEIIISFPGETDSAESVLEEDLGPDVPRRNIPPEQLELVLFSGSPVEIIAEYMALFGPAKLPPKWSFGPWISANRWHNQAMVEGQLAALGQYRFPATALVIEAWSDEATFYIFNGARYKPSGGGESLSYGDFSFPPDGPWQDPKAMIRAIHDHGLHLILWQIPVYKKQGEDEALSVQNNNDKEYAVQHKLCVMDNAGRPYGIPQGHWFAGSLIPDFTNAETRRLWFAKRRYLLDIGVDGFKTDGGEFIYRQDLAFSSGAGGAEMKNGYASSYTAAYEGFLDSAENSGDLVLFSRAGYAGQHTSPILWAGDQQSSFTELQSQLRAGLSAALSGILFWGFDIAGFAGPLPNAELYLRATQLACFCPVMQWHSEPDGGQFRDLLSSAEGNNERSPWNIAAVVSVKEGIDGQTYLDRIRFYHQLRMNLLPYLYSEARFCVKHNTPLMRPMVCDWPENEAYLGMEDQFMLGRNILVAPVVEEGKRSRAILLPPGDWYGLFDKQYHAGSQRIESAAGDEIPVFVRNALLLKKIKLPKNIQKKRSKNA